MKKIIKTILFSLCFVFSLSMPLNALATIAMESYDNAFFQQHNKEFITQERTYITNVEINLYAAPDTDTLNGKLGADNQCLITIHYNADDGTAWGYIETDDSSGWARLSELTVVYDYISFKENYGNEIVNCNEYFDFSNSFDVYAYPNSPTLIDIIDETDMPEDGQIHAKEKYIAPDGRVWYFCEYLYGGENFWFTQTSSPSTVSSDTTTNELTLPRLVTSETTAISEKKDDYSKEILNVKERAIIGLALLLIMTVAALVLLFTKKEKKEDMQ